jgi:hypothetical protein
MKCKLWFLVLGSLVAQAGWTIPAIAQPDPVNSYYVPQVGDYASPVEGDAAIRYFRACPNNHGGASLPLNARIMIVVKDSGGAPIPGILPADLCVLFNGGTAAQGFFGPGADSVIANFQYNQIANCPDVRCIPADAPTDANGVAYITFTGPGGIRDPNRKWGHYDSELPVFVLGFQIPGRLTSISPSGSYVLRIKNFDTVAGLTTQPNLGETVNSLDINPIQANLGRTIAENPTYYWYDFDSDGVIGLPDRNMIVWHVNHKCNFPSNP